MRAAAASLLLAMVVAWPRLAPPDPALPGADPAPLAAGEPPAGPSRREFVSRRDRATRTRA